MLGLSWVLLWNDRLLCPEGVTDYYNEVGHLGCIQQSVGSGGYAWWASQVPETVQLETDS